MNTMTPSQERRVLGVALPALRRTGYTPILGPGRRLADLNQDLFDRFVAAKEASAIAYGPGLGNGPGQVPAPASLFAALIEYARAESRWQALAAWEQELQVAVTVERAEVGGELIGVVAHGWVGDELVAADGSGLPPATAPLQIWEASMVEVDVVGTARRVLEAAITAASGEQTDPTAGSGVLGRWPQRDEDQRGLGEDPTETEAGKTR